jgi:hypothetical protein
LLKGERVLKAISILQPFADLVATGYKDVECRSWPTKYRGPIFILALKAEPSAEDLHYAEYMCMREGCPMPTDYKLGGIVGIAYLSDCVTSSKSRWHEEGTYGFVMTQARPVPFIPYRGMQKIFNIEGYDYLLQEYPPLPSRPHTTWLGRIKRRLHSVLP